MSGGAVHAPPPQLREHKGEGENHKNQRSCARTVRTPWYLAGLQLVPELRSLAPPWSHHRNLL